MRRRLVCWTGALAFACYGCSPNPPARSATSPGPSASSEGTANGGRPNELPPEIAKMLADQPCQPRLRAALDQHLLTATNPKAPPPFVIGVGEKLCLVGDSPRALKLTDKVVPVGDQVAQRVISAEFEMVKGLGAVFTVRNQFDSTLRYRAVIKIPNRQAESTSVCPVRAHFSVVETWPDPIEMIAFGDFAPLAPGDTGDCR